MKNEGIANKVIELLLTLKKLDERSIIMIANSIETQVTAEKKEVRKLISLVK